MKKTGDRLPEGIVIRAAELNDAAGMSALANLPGYTYGTLRPPYQREAHIAERLSNLTPDQTVIVATHDGVIIGDAFLGRYNGRRAHAATFGVGVHDEWKGRGVGGALTNALMDAADNWLNIRRIELTVYHDNDVAIRLYEKVGFEKEGLLRGFGFRDGTYVDAFSMARIRE